MAEGLGALLGKPLSPAAARQALHRARERFAALLIDQVADILGDSDVEQVEQELIDLGLLDYCRPALQRRAREG